MSKLPILTGPSCPPASKKPARQLVVFLHGVGADGDDLFGLAPYFAQALPDAAFISPNGPFPCDMAPYGRQWFSLLDRSPAAITKGVRTAAPIVDAFLDQQLEHWGVPASKLALVGFSQGTMMSLFVGPRRAQTIGAVVGFSGALVDPDALAGEIKTKPQIMLVHGDADMVVDPGCLPHAKSVLGAAGIPVAAQMHQGLGHSIDEEGLRDAVAFVVAALGD